MIECPVCGAVLPGPFLVREPVAVHQNLVVDDVSAARAMRRGRLHLYACEVCGFVVNAAFDPSLLSYSSSYDNTQSCSPVFDDYLARRVEQLVADRSVRSSRIVEVGCGKGEFLRALVLADDRNEGIGFDPSYTGPLTDLGGRLRFERRFYEAGSAGFSPDVVMCRHVIEHVPDPVGLLRVVRQTVEAGARVFFETPCVEWILANDVVWDFFYEHCSYFTASSLEAAFAMAGFAVDDVRHTFGGQYLWAEARAVSRPPTPALNAGAVSGLARRFADRETARVEGLRRRLDRLAGDGPVAVWGAAAKGVTLANLVDPDSTLVACIVDLNPSKQGHFLPGTGHPIVSPAELAPRGVRTAIVTNPNYLEENRRLLREASIDVALVDLMRQDG